MDFDLDGARVHCRTGGVAFDASRSVVVFLHGAGMDGSVWALQTRWFAHHGYAVLAPDFPAHGRSGGEALPTIDVMADWVARVLDGLGVASAAAIVGHSMGSLVAMATAARHRSRVSRLALVGTALEMRVGPDLLGAAEVDSPDAIAMVNGWGHGARAGMGGSEMPGVWMFGSGERLLARSKAGVLASDLRACNSFRAAEIAREIEVPVLIVQGSGDSMTPLKGARALTQTLPHARISVVENAGHMVMVEGGGAVLSALADEFGPAPPITPALTPPVGAPP